MPIEENNILYIQFRGLPLAWLVQAATTVINELINPRGDISSRFSPLEKSSDLIYLFTGPLVKQTNGPRVVVIVGEYSVKLQCNVKNADDYNWYKDGVRINVSLSERYDVKKNRFLEIKDVETTDSGLFTCVTSNNVGSANCSIKLVVAGMLVGTGELRPSESLLPFNRSVPPSEPVVGTSQLYSDLISLGRLPSGTAYICEKIGPSVGIILSNSYFSRPIVSLQRCISVASRHHQRASI